MCLIVFAILDLQRFRNWDSQMFSYRGNEYKICFARQLRFVRGSINSIFCQAHMFSVYL